MADLDLSWPASELDIHWPMWNPLAITLCACIAILIFILVFIILAYRNRGKTIAILNTEAHDTRVDAESKIKVIEKEAMIRETEYLLEMISYYLEMIVLGEIRKCVPYEACQELQGSEPWSYHYPTVLCSFGEAILSSDNCTLSTEDRKDLSWLVAVYRSLEYFNSTHDVVTWSIYQHGTQVQTLNTEVAHYDALDRIKTYRNEIKEVASHFNEKRAHKLESSFQRREKVQGVDIRERRRGDSARGRRRHGSHGRGRRRS